MPIPRPRGRPQRRRAIRACGRRWLKPYRTLRTVYATTRWIASTLQCQAAQEERYLSGVGNAEWPVSDSWR